MVWSCACLKVLLYENKVSWSCEIMNGQSPGYNLGKTSACTCLASVTSTECPWLNSLMSPSHKLNTSVYVPPPAFLRPMPQHHLTPGGWTKEKARNSFQKRRNCTVSTTRFNLQNYLTYVQTKAKGQSAKNGQQLNYNQDICGTLK